VWIEFHKRADVATIYFRDYLAGENDYSYVCEGEPLRGSIRLDLDAGRRLVSIEISDASDQLAPEILATARIMGEGRDD
jgi:uncharacterized protein YuzE